MTPRPSTNATLLFIKQHMARTGRFPTNREITLGLGIGSWRVADVLTQLVKQKALCRRQVAEKGTIKQPKYVYEVAA